jgi:outer membrane immunogenic protein
VVADAALLYALGGMGFHTNDGNYIGLYQMGGGVEFAVTDSISLRGEVVGQGSFTTNLVRFFDSAKATVGVSYHF